MEAQLSLSQIVRTTETTVSFIHERADGIFHVEFKKNSTIDISHQEENRLKYIELTGGEKRLFLYTSRGGLFVTKEARENARRTEPTTPVLARAVVTHNFADRVIAEFYMKFYRPYIPIRIFKDTPEAIDWLHGIFPDAPEKNF